MRDSRDDNVLPSRSCDEWAEWLTSAPEELLSPRDRQAFTSHVRSCATCAALREDDRLLTTYMRRDLRITPLPDLPASVLAEMHQASFAPGPVEEAPRTQLTVLYPSVERSPSAPYGTQSFQPRRARHVLRLLFVAASLAMVLAVIAFSWMSGAQEPAQVQAGPLNVQQSLTTILPHPGATFVHTVSWSPDGKYIAVLWDDSQMQVLDASTFTDVFSHEVGSGYGFAWSPDSQYLASIGREDNTIQIWKIATKQCVTGPDHQCLTYTGHTAPIEALAWSPSGRSIASASDDQTVQVWDAFSMKQVSLYRDPGSKVTALAWSPDGTRLVLGDEHNHVQTWDALTGTNRTSYRGHTGAITFVGWSPDGRFLLSSSYDGTAQMWNAETGQTTLQFSPANAASIYAADCLWIKSQPNKAYLALVVGASIQIWYIWEHQGTFQDEFVSAKNQDQESPNDISSISWSPLQKHFEGQLITGGSGDILDLQFQ